MPDESFAIIKKDFVELYDFELNSINTSPKTITCSSTSAGKQGFSHYMLKEIYEQKKAITQTISFYKAVGNNVNILKDSCDDATHYHVKTTYHDKIWNQLSITAEQVKKIKHIGLVAAGTSWHAGKIAQFFFENICNIRTEIMLASELRYKKFFPEKDSIFIMISQSGETADTLECLRMINSYKIPTIALTNVSSSTMVQEADGFMPMQAGPEISVASTKAFTTQITSLFWLANRIGLEQEKISVSQMKKSEEEIFVAAEILESSIENNKWRIQNQIASKLSKFEKFIFLGRNISYPFALESALKLKEISYIFAHAYPAGELKHGPIALIDSNVPVVLFSVFDDLIYRKILSNAQEVKARNGYLISFAFEDQHELINLSDEYFLFPDINPLLGPVIMSGVMQILVYQISLKLNRPIDKPRNLAKSVTVE